MEMKLFREEMDTIIAAIKVSVPLRGNGDETVK